MLQPTHESKLAESNRRLINFLRQATLQDYATLAGLTASVLAMLAALGYLRNIYRATLGRGRVLKARLRRLACNMEVEYFRSILGVPAFVGSDSGYKTLTWVEPELYVHAHLRETQVMAVSITVRARWLRPNLFRGHVISSDGETIETKLGRATYGSLPHGPSGVFASVGARRLWYSEAYYYGNPGGYQYYVYSLNESGRSFKGDDALIAYLVEKSWIATGALARKEHYGNQVEVEANGDPMSDPEFLSARSRVRFNTVTTLSPQLSPTAIVEFGPDLDTVRVVEDAGLLASLRARRLAAIGRFWRYKARISKWALRRGSQANDRGLK